MTASSQNDTAERPPELTPVPPPMPDQVRAAYAAYGVAIPAPAGSPALQPTAEQPQQVTTLQAAAAVMDAAMQKSDATTGAELAEAERTAGILFDAEHVEAVRTAALEQARAEYEVELNDVNAQLTEVRRQLGTIAGSRRQVEAVLRLCEGRRGDDMLLVSAVAVAAEAGTTALDGFPMTLTWTRRAAVPDAHTTHRQVVVECTSSYGGRAVLIVEGEDRAALGSLLEAEAHATPTKCPTDGCGAVDEGFAEEDPAVAGWALLHIAGTEDDPRWYCSPGCITAAMARAGDELAADDQAAAVDPDEQGPQLPDHQVDETAVADGQSGEHAAGEAEAACARCGCTESRACKGGCHWVPNVKMIDLCSACATPEELAYAAGGLR